MLTVPCAPTSQTWNPPPPQHTQTTHTHTHTHTRQPSLLVLEGLKPLCWCGESKRERKRERERERGVWVWFCVRFQAVKVPILADSQLRTRLTKQLPQSSSKGNFFVRVWFGGVLSKVGRLSEWLCFLLNWKTNMGNTDRTVLGHLERERDKQRNIYIYIYIHTWLWGHLPPQMLPFLSFFPLFYSKKWPKRDVANLPRLCLLLVNRNNPKLAWDGSPKPVFFLSDWDCSFRPFYWFILGLNVKFVGLFGPQKALNSRNVKHVKLYLSKKG